MWEPQPGERVKTKFGPAVILRSTRTKAFVELENGYKIEVSINELIPDQKKESDKKEIADSSKEKIIPRVEKARTREKKQSLAKRRAIEALRFGLVPEDYIEELTLGFDELKAWAISRFPDKHGGKPLVSEITGPFGTGKSHMMAAIRHLARCEGYVTACTEVDGQYVTLSDPAKLLYSIWSRLSAKNFSSSTPLLDLYLKALEAGYRSSNISLQGLDRIKANYATIQMLKNKGLLDVYSYELDSLLSSSDEFTASEISKKITLQGISRLDFSLKPMIGRSIRERPFDFIESLAGHAIIAKLAGYKGLILTIDEFEVEHNLSKEKLQRLVDLIRELTLYLSGTTKQPAAPLGIFIAAVGQDGHVGDAIIDIMINNTGGAYYHLEPWPRERRLDLASRIYRLYNDVYNLKNPFDKAVVDEIEEKLETYANDDGLIRAFIKRYIAKLDLLFGPPRGINGDS